MHRILIGFASAICAFGLVIPVAQARASLSKAEVSLVQAVNAARTTRGVAALRVDPTLERSARWWSSWMLQRNVFTHGAFTQRMHAFHVRGPAIGENLGWGSGQYRTAQSMVQMWLASPGHRANMLRAGFRRIGVGARSGTFQGESGALVVTADFAGR